MGTEDWWMPTFNLTPFVGNTIHLRWEVGTDTVRTDHEGWRIDDILVTGRGVPGITNHNMVNWTLSPDDGAGADDVVLYNIYRADNPGGPWDLTAYLDTVSAGTSTYTDWNKGEFDGTDWWYVVRAQDLAGNEEQNSIAMPEVPPSTYDINLAGISPGDWTFVSYPITANGDVVTIFDDSSWGDSNTEWDCIQWYYPLDSVDPWKMHSIDKPANLNDMPAVDNTMGFWIRITSNGGDQMLSIGSGVLPGATTNIQLYNGWNLVGYPSATARLASDTLPPQADKVAVYDSGQPYDLRDETVLTSVTMVQSNAYWVHVTADCTWQVDL
jgi:hypothetical protein